MMTADSRTLFLSTPSARRATLRPWVSWPKRVISIHALREEGDVVSLKGYLSHSDFYPRPPRGGRHDDNIPYRMTWDISIHALREEGD